MKVSTLVSFCVSEDDPFAAGWQDGDVVDYDGIPCRIEYGPGDFGIEGEVLYYEWKLYEILEDA